MSVATLDQVSAAASQRGFVSTRNRKLSLWQSAVEEMLRQSPPPGLTATSTRMETLNHPVARGTALFVRLAAAGARVPPPPKGLMATEDDPQLHAYLSQLHLDRAEALRHKDTAKAQALETECRQYATCYTTGWISCETTYLQYGAETDYTLQYNDWTVAGNGNPDYGVIPWQLPDDASVALIGDWGTGLPDAQALVQELMMLTPKPAAIIHIGDIYYAGTPDQCSSNFLNIVNAAAPNIPVFTIPGNHEYYDWGVGYYKMLPQLNTFLPSATQVASYFCLRTQDGLWQFLGGDTGQGDTNPLAGAVSSPAAPSLRTTEAQWHADKMTRFGGSTIFMTHHQLFTANDTITTDSRLPNYINMSLGNQIAPYFSRIAMWLWGHEHDIAIFQNGLFGLAMGRLVGSSAYEEATSDNPYGVKYPQVPFNQSLEPTAQNGYFPHACCVFNLQRTNPTDPINVTYYATPAWYETPPSPLPGLVPVFNERIAPAASVRGAAK